jgi:hypothetical protein
LIVFAITVQRITGSWCAAFLALLFFAGDRQYPPLSWLNSLLFSDPLWFAGPGGDVALHLWKDQNEMWSGICILATVMAAMSGRWLIGVGAFACAVMLKESGWLAALFVLIILLMDKRLRIVPVSVWICFVAVSALLVAGKAHVGMHLTQANNFHSLAGAPYRYLLLVAGKGLLALIGASWPGAVSGGALGSLAALAVHRRIDWRAVVVFWFIATLCAAVVWASQTHVPVVAALLALAAPECLMPIVFAECAFAFAAITVLLDHTAHRPLAILVIGSALSGTPAIVNCWETPHISYLACAFQAAIVAFVWVLLARYALRLGRLALGKREIEESGM